MKAVLTIFPFNVSDIKLASLVPSIKSPHQDALHLERELSPEEISGRNAKNFHGHIFDQKDSRLISKLTNFASFSASSSKAAGLNLDSMSGWIYELRQPNALFRELCAQAQEADNPSSHQESGKKSERKDHKQRLENKYETGLSEYFITGFCTFVDAKMETWNEDNNAKTGFANVPVGKIATAASHGAAAPIADSLDVSVEAGKTETHGGSSDLWAPGERVFAVSYQRVKFRLFKRGNVDAASINGTTQWIMINQTRGVSSNDPQKADAIEISLEDLQEEADELEPAELDATDSMEFLEYVGEDE